jgi:hypothetical protein
MHFVTYWQLEVAYFYSWQVEHLEIRQSRMILVYTEIEDYTPI